MNEPTRRLAIYDDILALPEGVVGEVLNGSLYTHPRPAPRHARAYSALGGNLGGLYDWGSGGPGGWWVLDEPELHLGGDVIVPDLAGWERSRLPTLPETAWFELAPDWACEILSPSTARIDRTLKMALYAREAVAYLWLVDPDARMLETYRLHEGHWLLLTTLKDDDEVCQPPFDTASFPLASLWV